jgi:hypothetical protein
MPHRVLHDDGGASRVPQHVGAVKATVVLQTGDVLREAVAAVAPGIGTDMADGQCRAGRA